MFKKPVQGDIVQKCVGTITPIPLRVIEEIEAGGPYAVEQVADDKRQPNEKRGRLHTHLRQAEFVHSRRFIRASNQWTYDDGSATATEVDTIINSLR